MSSIVCTHTFEGHTGRIFSIAHCSLPDGRCFIASASHDRSVRIWSLNDQQLMHTLEYTDFVWRVFIVQGENKRPLVVAFIPTEERVQVSDLLSGETCAVFHGRLLFAGTISLFPQSVVLTAVGEEDLSFIDVNTGNPLLTIKGGFEKAFRAVIANPQPQGQHSSNNDPIVVFTTWNVQNRRSTIQTYELRSLRPARESNQKIDVDRERMSSLFEGDSRDGVTSLVVTSAAKPLICSGHYDFVVRVWCLETRQLVMTLDGHSDYVGSVAAWRGTEPLFVSGSSDGTIKAWNTQTGALVATGEGHTRDVWALAVTSGTRPLIVSGSFDRSLRVWDIHPVLRECNWERRRCFCVFLSGLMSSVEDSSLQVKDREDASSLPWLRVLEIDALTRLVTSFI